MKNKTVWTWTLSAVIYLAVVIGGYFLVDVWADDTSPQNQHSAHNKPIVDSREHANHNGDHLEHNQGTNEKSEVVPSVSYKNNQLKVVLKDQNGNRVTDLEINHEKYLHFILVSQDLKSFHHLHPNPIGNGEFTLDTAIPSGSYKAFVDIKPKNLSYHVEPIPLQIGQQNQGNQSNLVPDTELTKMIDGYTVTLESTSFKTKKETVLNFKLKNGTPEPYLGALGHVVILDENGEKYVHVHPVSDGETKFATEFSEPGRYKMWAEFKLNGKVITYPFVIEVK